MDFVVETSNALVCPVFPQLGQNVAQSIRPITREESHLGYPHGSHAPWAWLNVAHLEEGIAHCSHTPRTMGGRSPGTPPDSSQPAGSHLVMVPSMSEMTTLSSQFHR